MSIVTKRIPVNAPTLESATKALKHFLENQRVNVVAIAPAEEPEQLLSFHAVALQVTSEPGELHTYIFPVEFQWP